MSVLNDPPDAEYVEVARIELEPRDYWILDEFIAMLNKASENLMTQGEAAGLARDKLHVCVEAQDADEADGDENRGKFFTILTLWERTK